MKNRTYIFAVFILIPLTSFAQNSKPENTGLPPVETNAPNSNYKPAFIGQTRVAGVKGMWHI